jgi:hypothetical protein
METFISFDLFISHAWHNSIEYMRIVEILNEAPNFYWRNYSSWEKDPIINLNSEFGKVRLTQDLEAQIKHVNLLIICADLYATHPYWINQQIAIAEKFNKFYVVVKPYANEPTPVVLTLNAKAVVSWETSTIVDAVKKHAS